MKYTKNGWMVVCVVTAMLFGSSMAWSATITPEADSYVADNAIDTNFGTEDQVTSRYAGSWSAKAYVRFDISSLVGAGEDIEDASLSFVLTDAIGYTTSALYSMLVSVLLDGDTGENWDESTITWNNAPGNDTTSQTALDPTRTQAVGYLRHHDANYNPGAVATIQIPNYLVDVLNADTDGKVTFIITGRIWSGFVRSYASRENTTYAAPTLDLTVVPEPMTMSLFGIGGLALLRRRQK